MPSSKQGIRQKDQESNSASKPRQAAVAKPSAVKKDVPQRSGSKVKKVIKAPKRSESKNR